VVNLEFVLEFIDIAESLILKIPGRELTSIALERPIHSYKV